METHSPNCNPNKTAWVRKVALVAMTMFALAIVCACTSYGPSSTTSSDWTGGLEVPSQSEIPRESSPAIAITGSDYDFSAITFGESAYESEGVVQNTRGTIARVPNLGLGLKPEPLREPQALKSGSDHEVRIRFRSDAQIQGMDSKQDDVATLVSLDGEEMRSEPDYYAKLLELTLELKASNQLREIPVEFSQAGQILHATIRPGVLTTDPVSFSLVTQAVFSNMVTDRFQTRVAIVKGSGTTIFYENGIEIGRRQDNLRGTDLWRTHAIRTIQLHQTGFERMTMLLSLHLFGLASPVRFVEYSVLSESLGKVDYSLISEMLSDGLYSEVAALFGSHQLLIVNVQTEIEMEDTHEGKQVSLDTTTLQLYDAHMKALVHRYTYETLMLY